MLPRVCHTLPQLLAGTPTIYLHRLPPSLRRPDFVMHREFRTSVIHPGTAEHRAGKGR